MWCGVQGLRAALNAALFRTGDQSRDFAVVLATNRPADLDPAVLDRMDEALGVPAAWPGRAGSHPAALRGTPTSPGQALRKVKLTRGINT